MFVVLSIRARTVSRYDKFFLRHSTLVESAQENNNFNTPKSPECINVDLELPWRKKGNRIAEPAMRL